MKAFASICLGLVVSLVTHAADVRYEGEMVSEKIVRSGKDLDGIHHESRNLRTNVYRIYSRVNWSYETMPVPRCRAIPGNGNGDWKGFWEASSNDDKAMRLTAAIKGIEENGGRQIVRDGYFRTKPRSWREFQEEIRRADNQPDSLGYTRTVLETYGDLNRRNLGYVDHEPDSSGNGDWRGYWDASHQERPRRLAQAVRGLGEAAARAVVNSGALSQVPRNWRDFADRIMEADRRAEMGFSYEVLVRYGRENATSLGYYDSNGCSFETSSVRLMKVETVRELDHRAEQALEFNVESAPLLSGESESFTLSFNGFDSNLNIDSSFYTYKVDRKTDSSGALVFSARGTRRSVTPQNSVVAIPRNVSGHLHFDLSDAAFDAEASSLMGELVVKMEFYQSRFLFDKKIGETEVRLPAGTASLHVDAGVVPEKGAKIYADYSVRRLGSNLFNNQSSREKSSDKLKF